MTTCKVHYCDMHKCFQCPCNCKPCAQVAEDRRLLDEMQQADYPARCEDHDWPADLNDGAKCGACGLPYDEWTEF